MTNINVNSIVKYVIYTGLWAVLLIPFFVANQMFFPYITGKNFAFRIIVEIIFALWVYLAFADAKYKPKFSWVLGAVGLFILVMAIADFNAVAPIKAFWSNFERMDGWITLIHLLMYLFVFGTVMKTEKLWFWFFRSSLITSVIMSILVLKEWISTGTDRVSVTLGNPIYVAVYFLFNFFFALILLYKDVKSDSQKPWTDIFKSWLTYAYILVAGLSVFSIWRTGTRGVILGLLGGLVVSALIIAIFEKKDKIIRNVAIGGLAVIVIIIGGFFAIKNTNFVKNSSTLSRLAEISWQNVSGQGQARQYVWPMAIKGFQEKPILGWGQDGFTYVFNKYYDPRMYGQEQWFDRAHDMPLDMLVAGGALGLITYLGIFVAALWLIWKRREKLGITDAALLVGVLAGYFAQNLFVFDNLTSYILFFVVLSYLHSSDTESEIGGVPINTASVDVLNNDLLNYVVAPLVVITLGISLWYFNFRPISANINLIKAMQSQPTGPSANLDIFKNILAEGPLGTPEIREQLLSTTPRVLSMDVDQKIKQGFVELSFAEIQNQLKETPNDARYQLFAGQFLGSLGQYEEALPYLQRAVELSPTKLTMLFELSKDLSYLGQKKAALDVAKKAYDLTPTYDAAKENYISALIINGDNKLVNTLLGGVTTTSDTIVRAYLINASEFLKKGDKADAVAEINNAIKIAPGFEVQGKQVIDGIWKGTIKE